MNTSHFVFNIQGNLSIRDFERNQENLNII